MRKLYGAVEPVNLFGLAEYRLESRQFVILAALHVKFVARAEGGRRRSRQSDGSCSAVDDENARARKRRLLASARIVDVHGHTLHKGFDAVDGDGVVCGRNVCDGGGDKSAAVTVQHSAEIELARFEQSVHFGVEQVHESARTVLGSAHRLVGNLDFAEKVFESERELRVIVAAACGQGVGLRARTDTAVYAVRSEFLDFLTPHVGRGVTYLCKKGIHTDIELICQNAQIKRL